VGLIDDAGQRLRGAAKLDGRRVGQGATGKSVVQAAIAAAEKRLA